MTQITFQDGKVVFRDGAVGTEQACLLQKGVQLRGICQPADRLLHAG
jgi:hypothetical protein